jgi:hypothetical protein
MYALLNLYDDAYRPLADLTWHANKVLYAQRHGYSVEACTEMPSPTSTIGYQKIHFIKDILQKHPEYEWIWWTGTDTMITNFAVRMQDRVDNRYHFVVAVDVNGINADSILVRNSVQGRKLIDQVLELETESSKHWDSEQRAIARVIGVPVPPESWPMAPVAPVSDSMCDVVKIVPQRYMNSFNYQLYHYTDQRDRLGIDGNWQRGDWLIHWPATSLEQRIQLANYYKQHIME